MSRVHCISIAVALALVAGTSAAQVSPLSSDTVGAAHTVTPPASYALTLDGDVALGGFVFHEGAPFLHTDGGLLGYNTALGRNALVSTTPGAPYYSSGTFNTAVGNQALKFNTSGEDNTATGVSALLYNTTGSYDTANGSQALQHNTTGVLNTASGADALRFNTIGKYNTAIGARALRTNTEGHDNTGIGYASLLYNETGSKNTASGWQALLKNTGGSENTADGSRALFDNTTGIRNTASGTRSLFNNTTGSRNTAVGFQAGYSNETGSSNIWIASYGYGAAESNTLRIGNGSGGGYMQLTKAFISGIANATGGTFAQSVCVDTSTDQLGPCSPSSARFKEDIADLEADSEAVFDLRPVRFRYRKEIVGNEKRPLQYGLIAEEVARIYPQLVTYDAEGRPTTVRYEALAPLLLNELKKERARVRALEGEVARLDLLESRLARLEASDEGRAGRSPKRPSRSR